MQTIVFDNFADGFFKLYRGGAAVFGNEIIGKDKYGRLLTSEHEYKKYVQPFFFFVHINPMMIGRQLKIKK